MIYRDFHGKKLSALGFGAMRLPVIDGDDGRIDEAAALRMVDTAMQNGINYYDTAWGYHGENSELVMGKALSRYPRDSFYVATKFPGYDPSNWGKVEEIFEQQLNLDWTLQNGKEKVELLDQQNIPVWVMEPLRGGKLAKLLPEYEARLKELRPDEEIPAWAFRFLQSIPSVTMILSGMSNDEQLEKNLITFAEDKKLNEAEMSALLDIAEKMLSVGTVPCTACHYCVSHCPQGLNIPDLSPTCWPSTMSMPLPAADSSRRWLSVRCRKISARRPVCSAEAVSRYVRSRSRYLKCWRISQRSWDFKIVK